MRNLKTFALTTAAIVGLASSASAAEGGAGFTSHHLVPKKDYSSYAEQLPADNKLALREYLEYEEYREPCQGYQRPPEGFVEGPNSCNLGHYQRQQRVAVVAVQPQPSEPMELRPVVSDYEVHFDFDEANIRPSAQDTIQNVVQDIERYNPAQVTVVGHADRSGPADYNVALSQDRAQAVSQALTQRGIPNRVIESAAQGESEPAVPTRDGVKLEENRRVEIQFRK